MTFVTIPTVTFEWRGIFKRGMNVLESTYSEKEFEHKFFIFSVEIKSYYHLNQAHRVTRNTDSNYV